MLTFVMVANLLLVVCILSKVAILSSLCTFATVLLFLINGMWSMFICNLRSKKRKGLKKRKRKDKSLGYRLIFNFMPIDI